MIDITTQPFTAAEIKKLAGELRSLDERIAELNDAKAAIFKTTKAQYGYSVFYGLKLAVQLLRSDPGTRAQKLAGNACAAEIIKILLTEDTTAPAHANSNAPQETMIKVQATSVDAVIASTDTIDAAPAKETTEQLATAGKKTVLVNERAQNTSSTGELLEAEPDAAIVGDAVSALVNLKFTRARAVAAVTAVFSESGEQSSEELILLALRGVGKGRRPPCLAEVEPLVASFEEFDEVVEPADEMNDWCSTDRAA